MLQKGLPDHRQGVGRQDVVVVEEQHGVSVGEVQRGVGGLGDSLGLGVDGQSDPRVAGAGLAQDLLDLLKARTVIGDAQGPAGVGLGLHRSDGRPQVFGPRIVHRHDHGH